MATSYTLMFNWLISLASTSGERLAEPAFKALFSLFVTMAEKMFPIDS
jgi:hypothetical protein